MLEGGSKNRISTLLLHPGARMIAVGVIVFASLALLLPQVSKATLDTPQILSYQGRLTDAQKVTVADGAKLMSFLVYDASVAGTCVYTAVGTCGAPGTVSVTVTDGLFNVLIGDTGAGMIALPDSLFNTTSERWLEIRISGETLTPRRRLVSSATALQSGNSSLLDTFDTSQIGGSVAFVPVTDSSGNLVLTKNLTVDTDTLFVDSTNNRIGVGMLAPLFPVDVTSSGDSERIIRITNATDGTAAQVGFRGDGPSLSQYVGLEYYAPTYALAGAANRAVLTSGSGTSGLSFWAVGAGDTMNFATGGSMTVRMTIDGSGSIGIGTASPTSLFSVGSTSQFQVNSTGAIAAATGITSSGTVTLSGLTASKGVFTNGSSALTSTGTLGVDQGGTGTATAFTVGSVAFAGASGVYSQDNANFFWDDTNNRLGIGTTSPATSLDIQGPYVTNKGQLYVKGVSDHGLITVDTDTPLTKESGWRFNKGGVGKWGLTVLAASNDLSFSDDTAVRVTFQNGGNVGIGTASPGSTLDVKGTLRLSGATSGYVGFAPAAVAGSVTYTLPSADGTMGQMLTTNGTGTLSWATDDAGANTALSNLITTSINQDLLPSADNTRDIGSSSLRWKTLHVGPGSVVVHNDATDTAKLSLNFSGSTGQLISDATTPIKITTGSNPGINMDTTGKVGIGDAAPASLFNVGTGNPLQIDSAGNIIKIRSVDYVWPALQSVSTNCLVNNGSGTLSWSACATGGGWSTGAGIVYTTSGGDKVGIGNSSPTSLLSVGASNQFQIDVNGNIIKLNNITTSFPGTQGAVNSILQNDGSGGLSWSANGAGIVTLQNAYSNSASEPEITLDTTRNDITIQNAAADAVANFFLFKNAAGTQVARISAAGSFISGSGTTTYSDGTFTSTAATYVINASGAVDVQDSLNADSITSDLGVSIATGQAYTGAGAVTLSSAGGGGLTVQSASGTVTLGTSTALTASGALTVSSGAAAALTLDSASDTLVLAASDTTLQRTAAGAYTIDLVDGSATTLSLTNSGAGIASVSLAEAGSYTGAGAVTLSSGASAGLTIMGNAASTWSTSAGNLNLVAAGTGTANVQIGTGGAGSTTPDLFVTDVKSNAGDPTGTNGAMYYNASSGFFRCFEAGAWKNCDTTGGSTTLQSAYNSGATITTAGSTDIAFTLTSGNFVASGAGAVNLTPTSASSFTSGGALTLTGGAASTWGTSTGNLTLSAAGSATGNVQIGSATPSATPDLLVTDAKSTAGDPTAVDGAIYYNASSGLFRIAEGGIWKTICNKTDQACGAGTGSALSAVSAAVSGNSIDSGDNAQAWNWALTTAAKTAFTFGETTASTNGVGNQALVDITTLTTSTAAPLRVTSGGTALSLINLASTGDFAIQDAGTSFVQFLDDGTVTLGKAAASGTLNFGVGSSVDTIHIGDGTGSDVITIGQASADLSLTDAQWSISSAGVGSFASLTTSGAINTNTFTATALTFSGVSPNIAPSTAATGITLNAATTGTVGIGGTSTGDILLGGGSGSTGCTVTNSTGAFTCSSAITTTATSGSQGWWGRSGTTLSPVTSGDNITTTGTITTTSSGTITSASTLTASNGLTLTTGALNLTGTSGSLALTGFGSTSITSTNTTANALSLTATALTNGSALSVTATNTSTSLNQNIDQVAFALTNAQTTNATNDFTGMEISFTNNPGIAGNTERAMRITNALTSNVTDNTVDALIVLDNADTTGTGTTVVNDALKITSTGTSGITNGIEVVGANVTNGLNLSGTFTTNLITSTNLSVTQAGLITTASDIAVNGADVTTTSVGTATLFNTNATTLNIGGAATAMAIGIGGGTAATIDIAGGSGATGCTVAGATGNLTCSGAIASTAVSGTQGWWGRSGTTLSPATSGDAITTSGSISTSGSGTVTSASTLTASNGMTMTTGALSMTATSGSFALSGLSASSISTGGNALTFTSSNFNTTATGINSTAIGATTPSTGAFTTATVTPSGNSQAMTITGTNVTSATLLRLDPRNTSGTLIDVLYGGAAAQTASINGMFMELGSTLTTATAGQGVIGYRLTLPTFSTTSNSIAVAGFYLDASSNPVTNGTAGLIDWRGLSVSTPNVTQNAGGSVTAMAARLYTGSITTAGTQTGLEIQPLVGAAAGTLTGINITNITGLAGTENAVSIGSGWDTDLTFVDASPIIKIPDGATLNVNDASGNSLMAIANGGSTGNLTVSGDVAVNGGDLTTSATTFNLVNTTATTVNFAGAATTLAIGPGGATATTVDIAGGNTATGCTVLGASGNLTCSGTITAGASIVINGSTTPRTMTSDTSLTVASTGAMILNTGTSAGADDLTLQTNGTTRVTLLENGNVGVGASPSTIFHISGTGNYDNGLRMESSSTSGSGIGIYNTDTGGTRWDLISNGSGNTGGVGMFQLWNNNTSTTAMVVRSNGDIGVGTTSNLNRFSVRPRADVTSIGGTTTASASTTITGSGTTFTKLLGIGDRISLSSAPSTYATITAIASDTSLTVSAALGNGTSQTINSKQAPFRLDNTSGGTELVMNDQGNLAINTATPTEKLTIVSDDNTAATNIVGFYPANLTQGIGFGFDGIRKIGTNANSDLSIDAKGTGNLLLNTTATGSVGIGDSTPDAKLDVVGDIWLDTTGSSQASPRVISFSDMNDTADSARIDWGGPGVAVQSSFDDRLDMVSYWGINLIGSRQTGTALSFTAGTASDPSVTVLSPAAARKALVVQGASSQTASLQEWQNSSGTILGSVGPTGHLNLGDATNDSHIALNLNRTTTDINNAASNDYGFLLNVDNSEVDTSNSFWGQKITAQINGTGDTFFLYGINSIATNTSSATIDNIAGGYFTGEGNSKATTVYGVWAEAFGGTSKNYAIYTGGGMVQIDADGTANSPAVASASGDLYVAGQVESNGRLYVGSYTSSGTAALCWDNSGGSYVNDCSGSPVADYAEQYPVASGAVAGDMMVIGTTDVTTTQGDVIKQLVKSSGAYQSGLMGVISDPTTAGDFNSIGYNIDAGDNPMPVALVGRVKVKVNVENGSIAVGDPLTSSSTSGVGMKATKPGMIIGRALEAWAGPGQGSVMVFVNTQYYVGATVTSDGVLTYIGDSAIWKSEGTATALAQGSNSKAITMRGSGWDGAAAQDVDFTFKNVVTNSATAKLALYNDTGTEVASINQAGDLSISGKFYPSDSGVAQNSKYIYYDSVGPSDYMRTNAAGWSTGSYDFAELFPSLDMTLVPGELVAFDPLNSEHILRARAETSSLLMGIVSTRPGFLAGEWKPGQFQIALAGRVPTRVSVENGAIKIGDPLTVSATLPGVAMKALDGNIVGYALEDAAINGTISVYVKSAYIAPKNVASQAPTSSFTSLDVYGILNVHGNMITEVSGIMGAAGKWEINTDGMLIQHVDTPNGKKNIYASGSAQATILLFGHAKLVNGSAMIALDTIDPGFTAIINPDAPMFVTVTPTSSDTNGLYVKLKSATGFVVADRLEAATMNTEFDWTLVAYRKGYGESTPVVTEPVVPAETTTPTAPAETTVPTAPAETTVPTAPAETTTPTAPAEVIAPTTAIVPPAEVIGAAPAETTTPTEPATTTQELVSEPAPLAP